MSFANSVILYNCKINHNGLFGCDFGGSGATRDSVMGATNNLATVKFSYSNCTYMRKDKTITVDENADVLDAAGVNYCRYINTDFSSNHYFYAFVEKIEYVAPQTSRLYIKTDVFMTYFHKIVKNQCYVEREHVADDTPFTHVLPEPVSAGDPRICDLERATYQDFSSTSEADFDSNYVVCVVKSDPITGLGAPQDRHIGGLPNAVYYYGCEAMDLDNLLDLIESDPSHGGTDNIIAIYPILRDGPLVYLDPYGTSSSGNNFYIIGQADAAGDPIAQAKITHRISIDRNYVASGARTNNRKCLNYPYNYLTMTNFNGSSVDLKLENFFNVRTGGDDYIYIKSDYSPTVDSCFICSPKSYEYSRNSLNNVNYDYSIEFSAFPQIAYTTNVYENYVARHANTIAANKINFGANLIKSGMSLGEGNPAPLVGTLQNILSYEASMRDMELQGDKIHGVPTGSVQFKSGNAGIWIAHKCIHDDDLKHVDEFFDRYGYNVSEVKTPQWNSRPLFNYIKTNGANIGGEIPQSDKEEINRLFDTGMTIWHTVGSYGQFDGANNLAPTR